MSEVLYFFKPQAGLSMAPAEIAQELTWGEDVDGLIDLPVKEIIDRLKAAFPQHRETPGLLTLHASGGTLAATWTWQHVKVELTNVETADRDRLIDVLEEFGCTRHEE